MMESGTASKVKDRRHCKVQIQDDVKTESWKAWEECSKNQDHASFIPMPQFCIDDLPGHFRNQQTFDKIKLAAHLTVRVRVNPTSPVGSADVTLSRDNCHGGGVGTGFVSNITQCEVNDSDEDRVLLNKSKTRRASYVDVTTAAHIYSNWKEEARLTMIDFFYDNEESRTGGKMKTVVGVEMLEYDSDADWCSLRCVTYDDDLATQLQCYLHQWNNMPATSRINTLPPLLHTVVAAAILFLPFLFYILHDFAQLIPAMVNPRRWRLTVFSCLLGYFVFQLYEQITTVFKTFLDTGRFFSIACGVILNYIYFFYFLPSRFMQEDYVLPCLMFVLLVPLGHIGFSCCTHKLRFVNAVVNVVSPVVCSAMVFTVNNYNHSVKTYGLSVTVLLPVIDMVVVMVTLGLPIFLVLPNLNRRSLQGTFTLCTMSISLGFVFLLQPEDVAFSAYCWVYLLVLSVVLLALLSPRTYNQTVERLILVAFVSLCMLSSVEYLMKPFTGCNVSPFLMTVLLPPLLSAVRDISNTLTVVIVSHPHGQSKHVTIGDGALHFYPSLHTGLSHSLMYTTATCKGSSGALILQLCRGDLYQNKHILHCRRRSSRKKFWNVSSLPVSTNSLCTQFRRIFHVQE